MNKEQINKLYNALNDPKIVIYFIPSSDLKEKISNGADPILSKMAPSIKIAILSCTDGFGVNLDPSLVLKFIDNSIDENNKYWLSMGEIRVLGH